MVFYYTGYETDVDLLAIAKFYGAEILEYIGTDSHNRPVYQSEAGALCKDTDPRADREPQLFTAGAFDGEPDLPVTKNVVLSPRRITW